MSWQATSWAQNRKTGSAARKAILLVLANYADEVGYCWPGQKTLSNATELSPDTVQRQIKKLAADGHITIEKRPRASGRWPAFAYRLHMHEPAITEPHGAARSSAVTQCHARTEPEPDPLSLRPGRAAPCGITGPQALRHEPSEERPFESSPPRSPLNTAARAQRATNQKRDRPEVIHHRIASKLGRGDVAMGWNLLGVLSESSREFLTSCERQSGLTDAIIEQHRVAAHAEIRRQNGAAT